LQCHQASDEPVGCAAVAGGVSVWLGSAVSDLRPGQEYGVEVPAAVRSLGIEAMQTSFESPWQNGVAERWIESCRRELLDHTIAVNERHLRRLLFDYVRYHHEDRTHLGLGKGTPARRICSANAGRVISHDRLGGLHHRYDRAA